VRERPHEEYHPVQEVHYLGLTEALAC
jgi:hypothetical protein